MPKTHLDLRMAGNQILFFAQTADNGKKLIPYALVDNGTKWIGGDKFSMGVSNYKKLVRQSFQLDAPGSFSTSSNVFE